VTSVAIATGRDWSQLSASDDALGWRAGCWHGPRKAFLVVRRPQRNFVHQERAARSTAARSGPQDATSWGSRGAWYGCGQPRTFGIDARSLIIGVGRSGDKSTAATTEGTTAELGQTTVIRRSRHDHRKKPGMRRQVRRQVALRQWRDRNSGFPIGEPHVVTAGGNSSSVPSTIGCRCQPDRLLRAAEPQAPHCGQSR
jgi:hypothetical protein